MTIGLLVLLLAGWQRAVILRWVASPLTVTAETPTATTLLVWSGDRRYDYAAERVATGQIQRVLLIPETPRWTVVYGISRPGQEVALEQLTKRKVPRERIEVLQDPADNIWSLGDRLSDWLAAHPEDSIELAVGSFYGRTTNLVLERLLPASQRARVGVVGLSHRDRNLTNWWKTRKGIRSVFNNYVWLGHAIVFGRPATVENDWNPDEFEERLKREWEGRDAS